VTVLERETTLGGLARTEERDGFRFDLGGHRFFTKHPEIAALWDELLGDELLLRPRLSRIRYRGRMFSYPLDAGDVLRQLGPIELVRALSSYAAANLRRQEEATTFEEWVTRRFGARLYRMFFATYTEKVWGVPGSELRAEWAAQRIRGLSFAAAIRAALRGVDEHDDGRLRTLVGEFRYPRLGPGQLWDAMRREIESHGGEVRTQAEVSELEVADGAVVAVHVAGERIPCANVISSLPMGVVASVARPAARQDVRDAASGLRYRDFLTVALILDGPDPFDDTWIYVHEPTVQVARIQNFRAWSPAMVPDPTASCLGLEHFCLAGDELWETSDDELVRRAADELRLLGLLGDQRVRAGHVVRVPRAYPIYDAHYDAHVATIRGWLDGLSNLQQIGRNGLHRYNNLDHSMLTGLRAAENLDGAEHDQWTVNADSWYQEEVAAEEPPYVLPGTPAAATLLS
jgi:protoporphyrinogen oxidase